MIAHATIKPTVSASVGSNAIVRGQSVSVTANNTATGKLKGVAAGGGILSGQGLDVQMELDPKTTVTLSDGAVITATTGAVSITSTSNATATSEGEADNYGGVTVIIGTAHTTFENQNTVTVNAANVTAGTSVTVLASSTDTFGATADATGGTLVAIAKSNTTVDAKDTTSTIIGAGTKLTAATNMSAVEAQQRHRRSRPTASGGPRRLLHRHGDADLFGRDHRRDRQQRELRATGNSSLARHRLILKSPTSMPAAPATTQRDRRSNRRIHGRRLRP